MRWNLDVEYNSNGTYATDLFNDEAVRVINNHDQSKPLLLCLHHLAPHTANDDNPLQAPQEEIDKHSHISDMNRRTYAAMVSRIDNGIGDIITALDKKDMLKNSIIIFCSDNGAPTTGIYANTGSNHPLRGQKESLWEGGLRVPSLIWSPLLKNQQRVSNQIFHVTDWLPSLAHAADIKLDPRLNLDGKNMWNALSLGYSTKSRKLLHNIDEIFGYSSYTDGIWKYMNGTVCDGACNRWLGKINNTETSLLYNEYPEVILQSKVSKILTKYVSRPNVLNANKLKQLRKDALIKCSSQNFNRNDSRYDCNPRESPCLFNIRDDPCEEFNLAWKFPTLLEIMKSKIEMYQKTLIPSRRQPSDPQSNPALHNYTWTWWQEEDGTNVQTISLEHFNVFKQISN